MVDLCSLFQKIGDKALLVDYDCKLCTSVRTWAYYQHRSPSSPCTKLRPPNPEIPLVAGLLSHLFSSLGKTEDFSSRSLHTKKGFFFSTAPLRPFTAIRRRRQWATSQRAYVLAGGASNGLVVGFLRAWRTGRWWCGRGEGKQRAKQKKKQK